MRALSRIIVGVFIVCVSIANANALSCKKDEKCEGSAFVFLVIPLAIETGIIGASAWAAIDPNSAAIGDVVFTSMYLKPDRGTQGWAGFAGGFGLGGYNLAQHVNKNKGWDVFAVNFVSWHLIIASYLLPAPFGSKYMQAQVGPTISDAGNLDGLLVRITF